MKKMSRLPHEQSIPDTGSGLGPDHDGLPVDGQDVEGHVTRSSSFLPGAPGTGGDRDAIHATDEDDVEGHLMGHTKGERLNPGTPGTAGD